MLLESALLVLNVLLCAVIIYRILCPKRLERTLRNQLAEVYQRWKSHRRVHPKSPDACLLCRGKQSRTDKPKQPPVPYAQIKSNRGRKKQLDSSGKAWFENGEELEAEFCTFGRYVTQADFEQGVLYSLKPANVLLLTIWTRS